MRKRVTILTMCVLVAVAVAWGATQGAHFFSASASVNGDGSLQLSWDEAGVGNQDISYTLAASSSATYACINGGGNHPKAANKQNVNGPISQSLGTFSPTNGRVTESVTVGGTPLPSTLICPSGQTFVLACVSYTGMTLTDTVNSVNTPVASVQRTFVNIAGCP